MPLRIEQTKAGGTGYVDFRVAPDSAAVHQLKISRAAVAGLVDAEGYLPPGLPIKADGTPVAATESTYAFLGPESVRLGPADHFVNVVLTGVLNRASIEHNLGRALTADEVKVPDSIRLI